MMQCEFCGAGTRTILSFESVPPLQNRFFSTRQEAGNFPLVPLEIRLCECCGHIHVGKESVVEFDEWGKE